MAELPTPDPLEGSPADKPKILFGYHALNRQPLIGDFARDRACGSVHHYPASKLTLDATIMASCSNTSPMLRSDLVGLYPWRRSAP